MLAIAVRDFGKEALGGVAYDVDHYACGALTAFGRQSDNIRALPYSLLTNVGDLLTFANKDCSCGIASFLIARSISASPLLCRLFQNQGAE